VFITQTAIVSFMFGDPNESKSTPAILLDISLAVWSAIIITPITAPFAFLFKRSGPVNMAHSIIDAAHIAAQQNRITALEARLNKEWIAPEPEEKGNDFCPLTCSQS
jgi:uncharacterized membrane protein